MDFPPTAIPLFVYGSLRPGMALWPEIEDAVIETRPASIDGRLHWHAGMEWPLLLLPASDLDAAPTRVRGELLLLTPGARANRIIVDEELLFGYEARWLPVSVEGPLIAPANGPVAPADGDPTTESTTRLEALVLVWNRPEAVGPAIPTGDFAQAVIDRCP